MMWRSLPMADALPEDRHDRGVTLLDERSASMAPIIRVGDRLEVAWAGRARAPRGAVVAYFDGRRIIAHRLLAWTRTGLLLKGDANRDADPPVDIARYCGEVVAVHRTDGRKVELTARRWRVAGALLAAVGAVPTRRLRWLVTRVLCHLAARGLP